MLLRIAYSSINERSTAVTTYDALGYYMYLPAIFIYGDYTQLAWKDDIEQTYQLAGDRFYQANKVENGNYVFKYYGGAAIMQVPFFACAHLYAKISPYPADGFSKPYQVAVIFSAIFYAILGFILLRIFLLNYYSDQIVAIVLMVIALATNLAQYISIDSGQTHAYLFFIYCLILYLTYKWYKQSSIWTALFLGASCGLAITTRPTEVICILIPLLWISNFDAVATPRKQFWLKHKNHIFAAVTGGFLMLLPQIIYWKMSAGTFIYDVGSKWSFASPFFRVLFGWEKGWFVYTPITIFFIIGLFYIKQFPFKKAIWVFTFLNIWVIISWYDWRYGGSYSTRALSQSYPVFSLGLAAFLSSLNQSKYKLMIAVLFTYLICVNIFQLYQYNTGILHYDHMNKKYYKQIYLNPNPSPLTYSLLDVDSWLPEKDRIVDKALASNIKLESTPSRPNPNHVLALENQKSAYFLRTKFDLKMNTGYWDSEIVAELKSGTKVIKTDKLRLHIPSSSAEKKNHYEFFFQVPSYCTDCTYSLDIAGPENISFKLEGLEILKYATATN